MQAVCRDVCGHSVAQAGYHLPDASCWAWAMSFGDGCGCAVSRSLLMQKPRQGLAGFRRPDLPFLGAAIAPFPAACGLPKYSNIARYKRAPIFARIFAPALRAQLVLY